jgi:hypothetical protein
MIINFFQAQIITQYISLRYPHSGKYIVNIRKQNLV